MLLVMMKDVGFRIWMCVRAPAVLDISIEQSPVGNREDREQISMILLLVRLRDFDILYKVCS